MSQLETSSMQRAVPEPLPDNVTSVQPGGGYCYSLELAWGRVRRWYLKTLRPGYVRRMEGLRRGDVTGAPHEVLDPRDLKYCRNLCTADWDAADDPFTWRNRLLMARWGLGELLIMGTPLALLATGIGYWVHPLAALPPLVVLAWLFYFFRDPPRRVPQEPGTLVAPCDGTVAEITTLEYDEWVGGPAVRLGIFLSLFNVHVNRSPLEARVIRLRYWPGKFISALNPASSWLNENMWIGLEENAPPYRRIVCRQIAGLVARRIVCGLRSGEVVERGAKFGMIKLGSRTELIMPAEGLEMLVEVGQKIHGGSDLICRYVPSGSAQDQQ